MNARSVTFARPVPHTYFDRGTLEHKPGWKFGAVPFRTPVDSGVRQEKVKAHALSGVCDSQFLVMTSSARANSFYQTLGTNALGTRASTALWRPSRARTRAVPACKTCLLDGHRHANMGMTISSPGGDVCGIPPKPNTGGVTPDPRSDRLTTLRQQRWRRNT